MTYWSGHVVVAWRQFTKITFDVIYILNFLHLYTASSSSSRSKDVCWKTDMNADLKATSEASCVNRWYERLTKMISRWKSAQNPSRTDDLTVQLVELFIRVLPQLIWSTKETQHLPLGQMSAFHWYWWNEWFARIKKHVVSSIYLYFEYTSRKQTTAATILIWCSVQN